MSAVTVYIDGGYLDKVMFHQFPGQRIDMGKLAQEMAEQEELLRAYYYHCLPYQSNPATPEESQRYSSMHRFITSLEYLPRFQVRLGRLVYRGDDSTGRPIFIQKRVDTLIGVDMAILAGKGRISHIALLSGDADLIPAVDAVKGEGVLFTLWHGGLHTSDSPARELYEKADERREITQRLVQSILR